MLTREDLLHMRNESFEDVDLENVPDIAELKIDAKKNKREKIKEVLESGRNPYFVKSGKVLIKIGFASSNSTIEEALESLVEMKY